MSLADLRDIFIIIVGALLVVQTLLLIVLIIVLIRLARTLQREVHPLIETATAAVRNVQGTSLVMGETIVKPLIATSAFFAGVRRGASVLADSMLRRKETR